MHDTAFQIGCLAMDIYSNLKTASVLEIGSLNVNGCLRDHVPDTTRYVGVDMESGPSVDVVVTPGAPLPFDDETFDLVMASSVFEHDSAFWATFVEMCRKTRNGGFIYINAPSNGTFHRYPEDHWRFYPDSGMALARWARKEGQDVTLVESFVADRVTEVYNDFVAVFRKGPSKKTLNKTFIYQKVMCYNVRTWQSDDLIHPRDSSEDMVIIAESGRQLAELRTELGLRDSQIVTLEGQIAEEQANTQKTWTDRCVIEQLLRGAEQKVQLHENKLENLLRERDKYERLLERRTDENQVLEKTVAEFKIRLSNLEETHSKRVASQIADAELLLKKLADADNLKSHTERELNVWRENCSAVSAQLEETRAALASAAESLARVNRDLDEARTANDLLQAEYGTTTNALDLARTELATSRAELAAETAARAHAEHSSAYVAAHNKWLKSINVALDNMPRWWSIMPMKWRRDKRNALLKRRNVFDAQKYLIQNPDVAGSRIDPLTHYILHGISEGRAPL